MTSRNRSLTTQRASTKPSTRSARELFDEEDGAPTLHAVARPERALVHADPVDPAGVGAAEVREHERPPTRLQPGVVSRDTGVAEHEDVVRRAAHRERRPVDAERPLGAVLPDDADDGADG